MSTATKEKIRVYALAKTLDVESKLILDHCRDLGYDVKNQLSGLEPDQAETVKQRIQKGVKAGGPAEPVRPAAGPIIPSKEKTIVKLPAAKPAPKPVAPTPEPEPEPESIAPPAPVVQVPVPPAPVVTAPPAPTLPSVSPTTVRNIPTVKSSPTVAEIKPTAAPTPIAPETPVAAEFAEPVREVAPPVATPVVQEEPLVVTPKPEPVAPAVPVVEAPVAPTPAPQVPVATPVAAPVSTPLPAPPAPPRLPSVGTQRVMNLNTQRSAAPRPAASPGANPPAKPPGSPPTSPPQQRPGNPGTAGTPPARTPAAPAAGTGTRAPVGGAGPTGERHRRMDRDRRPGDVVGRRDGGPGAPGQQQRPGGQPPLRPGQQPQQPGRGEQKPVQPAKPPVAPRQFTPEELEKLRKGVTVTELIRQQKLAEVKKDPNAPAEGEEQPGEGGTDEDGKKRPGKIVGRNDRHKDRAIRQEKRKAKDTVVIKDGHVELIEDNSRVRGRRPRPKPKLPGTIARTGAVPITLPISVRSLSAATGLKVNELIFKLKDLTNSLFTINSPVDIDVAEMIAEEKGIELEIIRPKDLEEDVIGLHKEAADDSSKLEARAPVVTIMGHVDHGKTSLLDKIRQQYGMKSDVVSTEAGGITQVIRAWRVEKDGKPVTFLDTPGHEAFTKMRARGANVTDIAVIVVAADDGVMPQTEEAINHAKAANVSIVVAINKVDLPNANVKKTEQQLYGMSLLPDSMGGDVQFVYTSAATGQGIDELLETLALVAEIKELKANPHKPAHGTCLEAYLSGDEGVMATVLVQEGTLHRGEILICGAAYGRVRAMYDDLGRPVKEAGPSVPVRITGLDEVPNADDHFHVVTELTKAAEIAEKRKARFRESQYNGRVAVKLEDFGKSDIKIAELKVILKAEAKGSIEAIKKELEKLVHEEVRVRVLHAGIGAISESDVSLALASPEDSMVIGFNVVPDDDALKLAEARRIPLREYNIIYQLTNDIKAALEGKLKPREDVIHLGRAVVRETFKISKTGTIAGCYVTQGVIERTAKIRVIRDGAIIFPPADRSASLESLKRFKDDQREVREGFECGMKVAGYDDIKVGDVIEAYRIEQVQRTL